MGIRKRRRRLSTIKRVRIRLGALRDTIHGDSAGTRPSGLVTTTTASALSYDVEPDTLILADFDTLFAFELRRGREAAHIIRRGNQ